jgi:hypothetical protein
MDGNENDAPAPALGLVQRLNEKLQNSLLSFCKSNASKYFRDKSNALHHQRDYRAQKKNDMEENQLAKAKKDFKEASWLHQQFKSPRCCKTESKLFSEFNRCGSTSHKLKFMKEQIHIYYLGLGWEEAHDPWSKDRYTFTAVELLQHLVNVMLPLLKTKKIPDEAPIYTQGLVKKMKSTQNKKNH